MRKNIKAKKLIPVFFCLFAAVFSALALSACSGKKKESSNVGRLTSEGYELPYEYEDGYKAVMKVPDNSQYVTISTTPGGNKVFHLKTTLSEDEVSAFYDEYFSTLEEVKPIKESDDSVGYFDKDARMILFNLDVWTADGTTNYKLGAEACDKIEDSKIWQTK